MYSQKRSIPGQRMTHLGIVLFAVTSNKNYASENTLMVYNVTFWGKIGLNDEMKLTWSSTSLNQSAMINGNTIMQ